MLFSCFLTSCETATASEDEGAIDETSSSNFQFPPVDCGAFFPGPPLAEGIIEATPGFAEEFAAIDLSLAPAAIGGADLPTFQRIALQWVLQSPYTDSFETASLVSGSPLEQVVVAAFIKGGGALDFKFLRRGLAYAYYCDRPLPKSLSDFKERYGDYSAWPTLEVTCAEPKDGPRILWEEPDGRAYVAETALSDGTIRETEVIFTDLRQDGQLDFAAYTDMGDLTDRSTFATEGGSHITTASPYTCLTCHVDFEDNRISEIDASGTGAGCQ